MKDKSAYEGFDFENVWAINSNKNGGYPYPKAIEQFVGDLEPMAIIESKDTDEDLIEISANGNISVRNRTTYYSNKDVFPVEELRIPETVNGITVTKIENSFLYRINKVKKVYIPKTVTAIGQNAFYQNDIESII